MARVTPPPQEPNSWKTQIIKFHEKLMTECHAAPPSCSNVQWLKPGVTTFSPPPVLQLNLSHAPENLRLLHKRLAQALLRPAEGRPQRLSSAKADGPGRCPAAQPLRTLKRRSAHSSTVVDPASQAVPATPCQQYGKMATPLTSAANVGSRVTPTPPHQLLRTHVLRPKPAELASAQQRDQDD